ncbi:hypothetical protein San01_44280 [Streptomyces angustmyceticus]|uniref:Uncharacterized protein n=1 Tax=Streptomyces angustmyceticus TaxID=285578 RepID=A0A5J4LJ68_9ACTN|nr:hypothetical protein San01_44280 [Streptomyces angustmyceticus]
MWDCFALRPDTPTRSGPSPHPDSPAQRTGTARRRRNAGRTRAAGRNAVSNPHGGAADNVGPKNFLVPHPYG